jgi:multiple sugar transport system ATP-binding protein
VRLPIGTLPLDDELRRALRAVPRSAGREVIAGMRPEHFEDAAVISPEQHGGATVTAKIDVLESLGSESYAYFDVDSDRVSAEELEELATDSGSIDLIRAGSRSVQMIARLSDSTRARPGQPSSCGWTAGIYSCSIPRRAAAFSRRRDPRTSRSAS